MEITIGKKYRGLEVIDVEDLYSPFEYYKCECNACGEVYTICETNLLKETNERICDCYLYDSHHELYYRFRDMNKRCYSIKSKDYKNYGAKGINVCDEWNCAVFDNMCGFHYIHDRKKFRDYCDWFYSELGDKDIKKMSVDRIDFNGPYSPANCRLTTMLVQNNNRSNNIQINGATITNIARKYKLDRQKVYLRYYESDNKENVTEVDVTHMIIDGDDMYEVGKDSVHVFSDVQRNKITKLTEQELLYILQNLKVVKDNESKSV